MSELSVTPGGVQVPADPAGPVLVTFDTHALRVALVARGDRKALAQGEWDAPGIYILLGELGGKGKTPIYVGKTINVRKRIRTHRSKPPVRWWRAVVIVRDTANGFNSAEIGYLEGRIAAEVGAIPSVDLHAPQVDIDKTLPDHLLLSLDAFVPTIMAALRIAGVDFSAAKDDGAAPAAITRQAKEGTVADLVAAGLLQPGTQLLFDQRGKKAEATVNPAGEILLEGVAYKSPSGAGKSVLAGKAVNGWKAWSVGKGGPTLAQLRDKLKSSS